MNVPLRTYRPPAAGTQNHRSSATTRVAPFAHLHIGSFANTPHNSSPITHNSHHSFSAKERDLETNLSYFGSRYYSADLSIWLSVDPMSGKYPSFSPYVYCADNPVKCVDPNGEEVWIVGEYSEQFYAQLAEGACSLGISTSMDRYGKIHAEYTGDGTISLDGQKLLNAFNDVDVCITMYATNADKIDGIPFCAGAFGGNTIFEENGICGTNAIQYINPIDLDKLDNAGGFAIHEISEAYEGARISMFRGISSGKSNAPNNVWKEAHDSAIAQPYLLDRYFFDINGNQTKYSGEAAISIGWYMPNSDKKIKEVDY